MFSRSPLGEKTILTYPSPPLPNFVFALTVSMLEGLVFLIVVVDIITVEEGEGLNLPFYFLCIQPSLVTCVTQTSSIGGCYYKTSNPDVFVGVL